MRKAFATFCLLGSVGYLGADDSGLSSNAAAYLHFSQSARAIGMGDAESAVIPEDSGVMHANPALLALLGTHSVNATSGALGVDRSLYSLGYSAPIVYHRHHDDMDFDTDGFAEDAPVVSQQQNLQPAKTDSEFFELDHETPSLPRTGGAEESSAHWHRAFVASNNINMAIAAGMTFFGISDIEGRSEFGDAQPNFQDAERDFSLSYAVRMYDNFAVGFTGKYLNQTLQSARAHGFGFDVGTWYGVPHISYGTLSLALTARDIGSKLKWTVPDPDLQTEFSYSEPIDTKIVLGAAYALPGDKWTFAADLQKASDQDARFYVGTEWQAFQHFQLRGGFSAYDPSFGFGFNWHPGTLDLRLDYAFQYNLHSFVNPQWITLSMRFFPGH